MNIDKNVPMPNRTDGARGIWSVLSDMDVGDSILVDGKSTATKDCPAYNAATQYSIKHGTKFTGRKEKGVEGKVRIWRTA